MIGKTLPARAETDRNPERTTGERILSDAELDQVVGGARYKGEIEVSSFSWGIVHQQTIGSATGGARSGKA